MVICDSCRQNRWINLELEICRTTKHCKGAQWTTKEAQKVKLRLVLGLGFSYYLCEPFLHCVP